MKKNNNIIINNNNFNNNYMLGIFYKMEIYMFKKY